MSQAADSRSTNRFKKLIQPGDRHGRLVAVERTGTLSKAGARLWLFRCDCGNEIILIPYQARTGSTSSCGCLRKEIHSARMKQLRTTHGMRGSPEYSIWEKMKRRCNNPNDTAFANYGGRGITVCERWRESFESFYTDVGPRPSTKHSIDRIDVNGNYEPSNVRWATATEQVRNRRNTIMVEFQGRYVPLSEVCESVGITNNRDLNRICKRVSLGWSIERALGEPARYRTPVIRLSS
jgi:hypothetical protein